MNGSKTKKALYGMGLACLMAAGAASAAPFSEGFNGAGIPAGWVVVNNSAPVGPTSWFRVPDGDPSVPFTAQSGPANSYVAANFLAALDGGNISDWLLTPLLTLYNGDVFSFYTESAGSFSDRMQVRLSTAGSSTNVGSSTTSLGDFATLLADINATAAPDGYPTGWTQVSLTLSGLAAGGVQGRIGFRYLVTDTSVNGNAVGIDTVAVASVVPEPSTALMLGLGATMLGLTLRRRKAR